MPDLRAAARRGVRLLLPGLCSLLGLGGLLPAAGCQCGYVLSQGLQHLTRSGRAVPLDAPELEASTTARQRDLLRLVPRILAFAREQLGLETGSSYTTFLDTQGAPISHVVTASHPLALLPFRWRFPFVGQVAYKGFYRLADAEEERDALAAEGLDARVSPVLAFSSLGWFEDPVLPSMLDGGPSRLASTIIHEATHRTVFFRADDSINESLATFVAEQGTRMFLEEEGFAPEELERCEREARAEAADEAVLLRLRGDLDALYRSRLSDEAKLRRKRELFATASRALSKLDADGAAVRLPASNTVVLSAAQYHGLVPLLARLQEAIGGGPRGLIEFLREAPDDAHILESIEQRARGVRS